MEKNIYKSAVDKIEFDENLESKIINHISQSSKITENNNTVGENIMKQTNKKQRKISVAAAACAVCLLSGVTYASVMNFRDVSHMNNGLKAEINKESNQINEDINNKQDFKNTKDQREKMQEYYSGYEIISEEKTKGDSKWKQKIVLKDTAASYQSDDKKSWIVDEDTPTSMITRYTYDNYKEALEDTNMPNIINKLLPELKISKNIFAEEYYTDKNTDANKNLVRGTFEYKGGNLNIELSKNKNNTGINVITDVNEVKNQRKYETQDGIVYQLSDSKNNGITKTTTLMSKGEYNLIIEFENLSDEDIYTILDNIDLSTLDKQ